MTSHVLTPESLPSQIFGDVYHFPCCNSYLAPINFSFFKVLDDATEITRYLSSSLKPCIKSSAPRWSRPILADVLRRLHGASMQHRRATVRAQRDRSRIGPGYCSHTKCLCCKVHLDAYAKSVGNEVEAEHCLGWKSRASTRPPIDHYHHISHPKPQDPPTCIAGLSTRDRSLSLT